MRILVLGAGATGGYFGGRLAYADAADVTFLVRQSRADQINRAGLVIRDADGPGHDLRVQPVRVVTIDTLDDAEFDLVLLACKAYDLTAAVSATRAAVRARTFVLPLLNGIRHLDVLDEAFGPDKVLGGFCHIGATLTPEGDIRHLNRLHLLGFGERTEGGGQTALCSALKPVLTRGGFDVRRSPTIMQDIWEKWVFLGALAGLTCLMRGSVGDICSATDGAALAHELVGECAAVATAAGFPPRAVFLEETHAALTAAGSKASASMLRDIEAGGRTEGEHVLGDLVSRTQRFGLGAPLLRAARCHLQTYEARRARERDAAQLPPI